MVKSAAQDNDILPQYHKIFPDSEPKTLVVIKAEPKDTIDDNNESQHSDSMSETFEAMDDNSSDTQLEGELCSTSDIMDDNTMGSDGQSSWVMTMSAKIPFKNVVRRDGRQWFGCNTCGKEYELESQLHQHWNQMHFWPEKNANTCNDSTHIPNTHSTEVSFKQIIRKDGHQVYVCNACGNEYRLKSVLDTHWRRMHSQPMPTPELFSCERDGCTFETTIGKLVDRHINAHKKADKEAIPQSKRLKSSEPEPSECLQVCPVVGCGQTLAADKLFLHTLCIHTIFKCQECGEEFVGRNARTNHMRRSHPNVGTIYRCDWPGCGHVTTTITTKDEHRRSHENKRDFVCDWADCGKRFNTEKYMRRHAARVHTDERPFACDWPDCEATYKTASNLKHHKETHTSDGSPQFKCTEPGCEATFKTSNAFNHHRLDHKGIHKYKCSHSGCVYVTNSTGNFYEHQTRHTNVRPFRCEVPECGREFSTKRHLKRHAVVHSDERPFTCDWPACEATFKTTDCLNSHRLTHEAIRQFKCPETGCDKSFVTRRCLSSHRRSHRNEKPYGCDWPECGQRFASNQAFRAHVNEHQGIRPYSCQYSGCDKSFGGKSGFRQHMKVVHKHCF
ncbi:unnamed protein product, partial [Medioppia subpectinata]